MPITGQDDNFFLTDTGGRIAKKGLSPAKAESFAQQIAQATAPQMTPVVPPAQAPLMQTMASPQTPSIWEQPAAFDLTDPSQIGQAAPSQQASTGGSIDLSPYNPPAPDDGITQMYAKGLGDYEKGVAKQQVGIQKMANAQMAEAKAVNEESMRLQKDLDAINEQQNLANLRRQQSIFDAENGINETLKQYDDAKIDPDRYFGGSTGKRLLAGLAIAFGEVGRAMTGSQTNSALNIINNAIEADVLAQKENRAALGQKATAQRQILSDLRTRFKDEDDALLAQKVIATTKAQQKIAEIGRRYGTEEAQGKADMLIGQLEQKKGEYLTSLFGSVSAKANKELPFNKDVAEQEDKLRTQRENSKEYQNAIARRDSVQTMQAAFSQPSSAGDISGIYAFMKGQDPGSTVREGEFATAQNAGGVDTRVVSLYNKLLRGERLTQEQRADFLGKMTAISANSEKALKARDESLMKIINARGLKPDNILINSPVAGQPGGATAEQISQTFVPDGKQVKEKSQTAQTRAMPGR